MKIKKLWGKWKKLALKIARFQAKVLLLAFYYTIATPFALIIKFSKDPMKVNSYGSKSYWEEGNGEWDIDGETQH